MALFILLLYKHRPMNVHLNILSVVNIGVELGLTLREGKNTHVEVT